MNDEETIGSQKNSRTRPTFAPMGVGQIIDATFRLYRGNFLRLFAIATVIQVPVSLLNATITSTTTLQERPGVLPSGSGVLVFLLGIYAALLIGNLSYGLTIGALTRSVSQAYLGDEPGEMGTQFKKVAPHFFPIVVATLLASLASAVGSMFCMVPGVFIYLYFLLAPVTIVLEKKSAITALRRSKQLAKGNLGKLAAIQSLLFIIAMVLTVPGIGISSALAAGLGKGVDPHILAFLGSIVQMPAALLLTPVYAIANVLVYYDLRIRKEGFDLEMLAANLNPSAQAPE